MIAFPASIHSIAQLVSKPKESKAQEPNIENSQYRDTFDTCSIGQALYKTVHSTICYRYYVIIYIITIHFVLFSKVKCDSEIYRDSERSDYE